MKINVNKNTNKGGGVKFFKYNVYKQQQNNLQAVIHKTLHMQFYEIDATSFNAVVSISKNIQEKLGRTEIHQRNYSFG